MPSPEPSPSVEDLSQALSLVLEGFAYLSSSPSPVAQAELPLAVRAALPAGRGWLLLRSTRALALALAESSSGEAGSGLEEDAFAELCNQAASHLVSRVWLGPEGDYSSFVPKQGRPDGSMVARSMLEVEGHLLEASYWKAP